MIPEESWLKDIVLVVLGWALGLFTLPIVKDGDAKLNANDKSFDETIAQILALREALATDPITKLFSHCLLVANEKADLSRNCNAQWGKYFPKQ